MTTYEQGVKDAESRITALLDEYDIEELIGGGYILKPRWVMPDKSWKGVQHKTGSVSSYWRNGCRCDACRAFASEYQRERRLIRKGLK